MPNTNQVEFEEFQAQVNALLTEAKLTEKIKFDEVASGLTPERLKYLAVEELKRLETVVSKILELKNIQSIPFGPSAPMFPRGLEVANASITELKDLISAKTNKIDEETKYSVHELTDEIQAKGIPFAAKRATIKKLENWRQAIAKVLLEEHMKGSIEEVLARPFIPDRKALKAHARRYLRSFVPIKSKKT